jgi:dimethylhistidine N-methyltransferase
MNLDQSDLYAQENEHKAGTFLREVLMGLSKTHKSIDPKYLYDKRGSELFEQICLLEEYYPTRAEKTILKLHAREMARMIGHDALIVEPGSGSGDKFRILLKELLHPAGYIPIEISRAILLRMTEELHKEFPELKVIPHCADFTMDLELPVSIDNQQAKKVIFFPGSTIGNFHKQEAVHFLKRFSKMAGPQGALLIGVDLKKEKERLLNAYDDSLGVTAAFNLNLLERLNREFDASFDISQFQHEVIYNEKYGRVEMYLKSIVPQFVRVNQTIFRFSEGETIHTECSYKYSVEEFCELAAKAELQIKKFWKDPEDLFCMYYFEKL